MEKLYNREDRKVEFVEVEEDYPFIVVTDEIMERAKGKLCQNKAAGIDGMPDMLFHAPLLWKEMKPKL